MKERKLWKQISAAYMSDEETDTEEGGFIVHQLNWRSKLLNLLITRVDKRYEEGRKVNRAKPRESRRLGVPSTRPPPANAVKWALDAADQGMSSSGDACDEGSSSSDSCDNTNEDYGTGGMGAPQSHTSNGDSTPREQHYNTYTDSSNGETPHGLPGFLSEPTALFENEISGDDSDEEINSLIRAATMKMC